MTTAARTIGGPGAGKTYRALDIVGMCLEEVIRDPLKIGFVSFTRTARQEAAQRAASKFNLKASTLEKEGWFRTLHSCCYRCLGITDGEILTGTADDNKWLKEALNDESARFGGRDADDYFTAPPGYGPIEKALGMWDTARNRLVPLEMVWHFINRTDSRCPDLRECWHNVGLYERAKKKDGRIDFCDLLMKFAGRRWTGNHNHPFEEVPPEGDFPILPVWLHDEAQDMSLLTALVFKRLTQFSQFVYLMGDAWQAVYGWCGSDGAIFSTWPVAKEEILPVSYRCHSNILAMGDRIMLKGGAKVRAFKSKTEGGTVRRCYTEDALASVKPGEDTLVLARTNEIARVAARALDDALVPWRLTKGDSKTKVAPAREAGVAALVTLRAGGHIDATATWRMLQLMPAKASGCLFFERGIMKWYDEEENRRSASAVNLASLQTIGATAACQSVIASGEYKALLDEKAARMAMMAEVHGIDAVGQPTVRVGTIHSSKGQEAEHVVLINELPYPTLLAMEEAEGMAEERRVWYTGVTRAKGRLTIGESEKEGFPL